SWGDWDQPHGCCLESSVFCCILLTQERSKFKMTSAVSAKCVLLSRHQKVEKSWACFVAVDILVSSNRTCIASCILVSWNKSGLHIVDFSLYILLELVYKYFA
ncbi:mCG1040685, partial [Mus musculus]